MEQNSTAELISFCQIMTTALKSGKPLPQSLLNLNKSKSENSRAVIWCRELGKSLSEGYPLEEAVKQLKSFDPVLSNLLKLLGQNRLLKMLEAYTRYLVIIESLNQKVFAALIYPFIILVFICAILLNFNFLLFPRAMNDMAAANMPPSLMMKLLYFADLSFWPLALILPLIIFTTFIIFVHFMIRGIHCPNSIIGAFFSLNRVVVAQNAARAQAVIALYLEAGYSLEDSLLNASQLFDQQEKYQLKNVAEAIKRGNPLKEAFELSPLLKGLSSVADTKENLSEIFRRFSNSNFKVSVSFLTLFTDVSAVLAMLMAGFFVLCITSGLFDTYYWLIWSY